MKVCPQCRSQYASENLYCPIDGTKLELSFHQDRPDHEENVREAVESDYPSLFGDEGEALSDKESASSIATEHSTLPEVDPLLGTLVDDHYEILSIIGKGGMSVVYVAKDVRLKKIVALKMMLPYLLANPLHMQRFQQEAEAASNLSHPNIIGVHNCGLSRSGRPYLVMDYCAGNSLSSLIAHKERLEVDRAVPIFVQIAGALAHAHEKA